MIRSCSGFQRAGKPSRAFQDKLARVREYFEFDKQVTLRRLRDLDSCLDVKHDLVGFIEKLTFSCSTTSNSSFSDTVQFTMEARELTFLLRHIEHMAMMNNTSHSIHPKR